MLEIELQMVAFTSVSSFSWRRGAATSEAGSGSTAGSVGFVVVFSSRESATFVFIGTGSTHFKLKAKRTNGIVFCVEIVDVLRVCFCVCGKSVQLVSTTVGEEEYMKICERDEREGD